MKTRILILSAALLLTACSSLPIGEGNVGAKLIVQAATMKYIERGDAWSARAAAIGQEVDKARTLVDFEGITLADLQAAVIERLKDRDLPPSDMVLAMAVIDIATADLKVKIGEGVLSAEQKVTVNAVLGWIEQATSFY